jgi:CDP-diacylglycerol--serine O-phosphatidyltransferase
MVATHEGRFVDAGWLIIWAVLLDRLDGFVARLLKATSEFGVQMDSLADAVNFGVAPSFLVYVSLSSVPALGFDQGVGQVLLLVACGTWTVANVFRLAKFNVVTESGPNVFFGVPTTLAAGVLGIWYIVLHKYSAPGALLGSPEAFRGFKLFGDWTIGITAWSYLPAAMLVGAFLMASNLPQPKLGKLKYKWLMAVVFTSVILGYVCGFARFMPDFMALMPTTWLVVALVWGQVSRNARSFQAPPFLPKDKPGDEHEDPRPVTADR